MVKIEDLKRISLLKEFPEHLLDILAREAQVSIFGADTQLISVDRPVDQFYMLIMGQVAKKRNLSPKIDVILDYIQSGSFFGTAVFFPGNASFYTAVCQEPCEIITLSAASIERLFAQNAELGYRIMFGISKQYKRNMDSRAQMIMKTLGKKPDLKDHIKDMETLTLTI